jgi:hypothetical protein
MLSNKLIPLKFKTKSEFPSTGNHTNLYINEEKGTQSIWNSVTKGYDVVGTVNASEIVLDTTNFKGNLDSTIITTQHLANKIDEMSFNQGGTSTPTIETYSNTSPSTNIIGNIQSGIIFSTPQTMQEMFDFLFYYASPIVLFYASASQGFYEIGTTLSNLTLTNNITKKSYKIIKIEYYKNNMILNSNNFPNANGGVDSVVDTSTITTSTNYYSKVYDEKGSVISNVLQFNFVYPCYIGSLSTMTPSEAQIKSMTKRLSNKSNQSCDYTMSSQYFCFAYPTSWGNLSKILDPNSFEILNTFNIINANFTMIDNKSIPYTIYISSVQTTQSNFTVSYNF